MFCQPAELYGLPMQTPEPVFGIINQSWDFC
jgi:hypothetical protein